MDTDKEKKRVSQLCKDFLPDAWNHVSLEDIDCKQLTSGFGNQTFHCSINHCHNLPKYEQTEPKEAIVRVYGSLLFGQKDRIKLNIEAGESLTLHILSLHGIAPKVFGIFSGGVMLEYIESNVCTVEDLLDPDLCAAVVRKIAKVHTMSVPVMRRPRFLEKIDEIVRSVSRSEFDFTKFSLKKQKECEIIFDFPFEQEFEWIQRVIPKLGSKVVFSHNELNPNNILLKKKYNSFDDRVVFVDYEFSSHYYRAYDVAQFIKFKNLILKPDEKSGEIVGYFAESEFSERQMIIEEYLKESKKLNPKAFDEKVDTVEHLSMEVGFFDLVFTAFLAGLFRALITETTIDFPLTFVVQLVVSYENSKRAVIQKYGDPMNWK